MPLGGAAPTYIPAVVFKACGLDVPQFEKHLFLKSWSSPFCFSHSGTLKSFVFGHQYSLESNTRERGKGKVMQHVRGFNIWAMDPHETLLVLTDSPSGSLETCAALCQNTSCACGDSRPSILSLGD